MMTQILVTGVSGFIGAALSYALLDRGRNIVGIDNLFDNHDLDLKYSRLNRISDHPNFSFIKLDISNRSVIQDLFQKEQFECFLNKC